MDRLQAFAEACEQDLARIHVDDVATVTVEAYPDEEFQARIVTIGDVVDPDTRTVKVWTWLNNDSNKLKPEMYAKVRMRQPYRTPWKPVIGAMEDTISHDNPVSASCGCPSASESSSVFQQALQAITTQTAPSTDPQPSLSVNGTQGHHHHHHHHGEQSSGQGDPSFIAQLAQAIVSDLQQSDSTTSASSTSSPSAPDTNDGSFIERLGSAIATDLLAKYQQTTGGDPAPSLSGPINQMSAIA